MPTIRPITDLRNTSEISELCHSQQAPVFITKNGYGDLVVMSMATYEQMMAHIDLYKKLGEAEAQLRCGEEVDGDQMFADLRKSMDKKYNYKFTPLAKDDFNDIFDYVALELSSLQSAENLIDKGNCKNAVPLFVTEIENSDYQSTYC